MADGFDIRISGIEETCAMLDRAPKAIVKSAFAKALAAAAVPVVEALEPRIPVKSGDLKNALMTDISIEANGKGGIASIGFGKEGHKANWIEYGHRMVGHKPDKKELGEVEPKPFMRPAAADAAEASVDAFADSLRESLEAGISGVNAA